MDTDDIVEALPGLDVRGLKAVKMAVELLLASEDRQPGEASNAALMWHELQKEGEERGYSIAQLSQAKSSRGWSKFNTLSESAVCWMDSLMKLESKTEKMAALRLIARAIFHRVDRLVAEVGFVVTTASLLGQMSSYKPAMKLAWPGGSIQYRVVMNKILKR